MLTKPGRIFAQTGEIPELLNGVPRLAYPTGVSLSAFLFALLPPFWAYVALEQAVHLIGLLGMYWLLKDHLGGNLPRSMRLFLAFTFACLPVFVIHDASITGQAAVGWALLHLHRGVHGNTRKAAFGVLALYPFVSVLPTAGAFVIAVGAGAAGVSCIWERRSNRDVWLGLGVLVAFFIVTDWAFVHAMLVGSYTSHRDSWNRSITWTQYFSQSLDLFLFGQSHAASVPTICLIVMAATALIALARKERERFLWMLGFLGVCALLSFLRDLPFTPIAEPLRNNIRLLRVINIRTFWCVAPICFFGFALALQAWWTTLPWRFAAIALACTEFYWISTTHRPSEPELAKNYAHLINHLSGQRSREMTYADFMATPVYESIQRYIDKPQDSYRVISVGIDPARAAINGFYTADGYHNNYPFEYKARFRRLIADNLDRDKWSRRRFDGMGSRAVVFIPGDRGQHYRPGNTRHSKPIKGLTLNLDALHDLNVRYVLASSKLEGESIKRSLSYVRSFKAAGVPLVVHLYQVR